MSKVDLIWLIWGGKLDNRDLSILSIEQACFGEYAWTKDDFSSFFKSATNIGIGAYIDTKLVGYILYSKNKNTIEIQNLAVYPDFQRQGVGTRLLKKIQGKLTKRTTKISIDISEDNLPAHLFFQKNGFLAINIKKDFFANGRDSYYMEYQALED